MMEFLKKHWPLLLILILSGFIVWPLFLPGYFSHHDDLQVMRIYEMRKCLEDLQIPCRWVPDMGYGNGFPLFNYYGVLPYYIGALLSYILGFVGSAKALFLIPLVLGGITMYLLGRELFGVKGGVLSSVLYLFAPYRALDSYVRGAIDESFALAIIPLVFYFIYRLVQQRSLVNLLGIVFSLGAFLITHNIMTLFFTPVIFIWAGYLMIKHKFKNWLIVVFGLILSFGLAAFFIIPAFFEKSLVQIDSLTAFDLNFRAHFVTVKQLFLVRGWGYGASIPGPYDTISLQIGWPHWILAVAVLAAVFLPGKRLRPLKEIAVLLGLTFVLSLLMTHNRSAFIWEKIDLLRFAQFPWRFLSLTIFSASLLGGLLVMLVRQKNIQTGLMVLIITAAVILNWTFFKPYIFYFNIDDQTKLSGVEWEKQQKAAILDYLPKTAVEPLERAPVNPLVINGKATVTDFVNRSNWWSFKVTVEESTAIELPIFDFPNWQVYKNGQKMAHSHNNYLGRIMVDLPAGEYELKGKLENTAVRTFSNMISVLTFLSIVFILVYGKIKKKFI